MKINLNVVKPIIKQGAAQVAQFAQRGASQVSGIARDASKVVVEHQRDCLIGGAALIAGAGLGDAMDIMG